MYIYIYIILYVLSAVYIDICIFEYCVYDTHYMTYIYLQPICPSNLKAVSELHPLVQNTVFSPKGRILRKGRIFNI